MCKYCENISESWQIEGQEYDVPPLEYLLKSGIELIIKDGFIYAYCQCGTNAVTEIDFCPKCGNPLGEVKPLTVEQLREMGGKPVFLETGEILINEQIIGRWNIIHSVSDTHAVFMGGGNGFRLDNYGTTWLAYLQEPKGETE